MVCSRCFMYGTLNILDRPPLASHDEEKTGRAAPAMLERTERALRVTTAVHYRRNRNSLHPVAASLPDSSLARTTHPTPAEHGHISGLRPCPPLPSGSRHQPLSTPTIVHCQLWLHARRCHVGAGAHGRHGKTLAGGSSCGHRSSPREVPGASG